MEKTQYFNSSEAYEPTNYPKSGIYFNQIEGLLFVNKNKNEVVFVCNKVDAKKMIEKNRPVVNYTWLEVLLALFFLLIIIVCFSIYK